MHEMPITDRQGLAAGAVGRLSIVKIGEAPKQTLLHSKLEPVQN